MSFENPVEIKKTRMCKSRRYGQGLASTMFGFLPWEIVRERPPFRAFRSSTPSGLRKVEDPQAPAAKNYL
jgi:hypothetical protein